MLVTEESVMKPKAWAKPPRHGRKRLDDAGLRNLGDNIAALGMLNPIECLPDGEIISGFHRWLAAMAHEAITEVPVRIIRDSITSLEIRVRRVSENLQRSDLSFYDKWLECRGFREDEPGITAREIAAALNVDASTVTRYLCLDDCIEAVREAAKTWLGVKACYQISLEPPERQAELLAKAQKGGAAKVAKARQEKAGTVPADRVSKFKFPMPSGIVVALSCGDKSLSMDDAIHELSEALAELKAAKKQKDTPKSFMERCKNRNRAGGDGLPATEDPVEFEVPHV